MNNEVNWIDRGTCILGRFHSVGAGGVSKKGGIEFSVKSIGNLNGISVKRFVQWAKRTARADGIR